MEKSDVQSMGHWTRPHAVMLTSRGETIGFAGAHLYSRFTSLKMISLIHRIYSRILIDGICDLIWTFELSPQDKEGIAKLKRWRSGQLNHDDTLLDSDKQYLLLVANDRLFLVEREGNWRCELDERDIDLYTRKGRASFRRIRRQPYYKKNQSEQVMRGNRRQRPPLNRILSRRRLHI